ncbi:homeobox-domain-containing protein [Fistulina hepatica ATCC 64428]|uniref:Homeobox-domain-containing protein n=1 Tax=Fistulina hepatica ATCC 64428 TaxID=1128425 RepID=A0A0D7A130_9AGAR|nr:homeobox-domain-containing protein [Fistulina hepatica ATCC 64428]
MTQNSRSSINRHLTSSSVEYGAGRVERTVLPSLMATFPSSDFSGVDGHYSSQYHDTAYTQPRSSLDRHDYTMPSWNESSYYGSYPSDNIDVSRPMPTGRQTYGYSTSASDFLHTSETSHRLSRQEVAYPLHNAAQATYGTYPTYASNYTSSSPSSTSVTLSPRMATSFNSPSTPSSSSQLDLQSHVSTSAYEPPFSFPPPGATHSEPSSMLSHTNKPKFSPVSPTMTISSREPSSPVSPTTLAEPSEPVVKKKRRRADPRQLKVLNDTYARTHFPTTAEREALAKQLDMTPRSVQIWFQNRRQAARSTNPHSHTSASATPSVDVRALGSTSYHMSQASYPGYVNDAYSDRRQASRQNRGVPRAAGY